MKVAFRIILYSNNIPLYFLTTKFNAAKPCTILFHSNSTRRSEHKIKYIIFPPYGPISLSITSNILDYIKKKRIQEKKTVLCIQKTFNTVFTNGFNLVLGLIPCLILSLFCEKCMSY